MSVDRMSVQRVYASEIVTSSDRDDLGELACAVTRVDKCHRCSNDGASSESNGSAVSGVDDTYAINTSTHDV